MDELIAEIERMISEFKALHDGMEPTEVHLTQREKAIIEGANAQKIGSDMRRKIVYEGGVEKNVKELRGLKVVWGAKLFHVK